MSRPTRKRRNPQSGVTLLEVMVVLAIIALIAGLAGPRLMDSFGRAKARTAAIEMENLKGAVQLFYLDVGRLPSEAEGLRVLLAQPEGADGWLGPYLDGEENLNDPWEREYLYRSPGSEKAFDILSYGRDGRAGGTSEDSDISL
jgi:general secretion pathway protein G